MLAGCSSEAAITPPVGTPLLGPTRPSTGVHDGLYARALVLGDGDGTRVALVTLDLIGLDFSLADEVRREVTRATGITFVLLNCSHTHSAPFTIPWSVTGYAWLQAEGRPWRDNLPGRVTQAVSEAAAGLQEAALSAGRAPAQIGLNRRLPRDGGVVMAPNPNGTVVPWVDVLRVDDARGRPMALLYSHACHPVAVHAESTLISADFPAFAGQALRERLGSDVLPLFAQGCGASLNTDPLAGGFEAAERAGRKLGEAAVAAAEEAAPLPDAALRMASLRLQLPLADWPPLAECDRGIAHLQARLAGAEDWSVRNTLLALRDLRERAARAEEQCLRFDLQGVRIGDEWCLVAMPHEVVADYQLWAQAASPAPATMVWGYTNGCESYVPTDADLAQGGYEAAHYAFPDGAAEPVAGAALLYPYRRPLRAGADQQIKAGIATLWRGLGL